MEENFWDFCYICIESAALAVNNCLKRIYRVVHINQLEQQRFCTANLLLTVVPQWLFHCTQTHTHTHTAPTHTHTHMRTHTHGHTHTRACAHPHTHITHNTRAFIWCTHTHTVYCNILTGRNFDSF